MLCPILIGQTSTRVAPSTEVAAGTAFALLVDLAAASRAPREAQPDDIRTALDAVGDTEGETWLNLLGVALDAGAPHTAERLAKALRRLDGVEIRRHLLGRYAWSWCTLGGVDDIEHAAAGDPAAAARLLAKPRYYGGDAASSLAILIGLDAEETKRRLLAAVEAAASTLPPDAEGLLAAAERTAAETLTTEPLPDAIERLTTGYRYVPEVEAERIVLIPHLEPSLPLVLAQHRSARLIAYRARADRGREERAVTLGRALADAKRVEILALVGRGVDRSSELVEATGLSRSTVHHHLGQLREAGLVALEGNARAYTYAPRHEAVEEIADLIAHVVGTEER
jgi:DNA-binding transcriptional ArsR family regulator